MSLTAGIFEQVDAVPASVARVTETLLRDSNSIPSSDLIRTLPDISEEFVTTVQSETVQSVFRKLVINSTTESVNILQDLANKFIKTDNISLPEVIINRPEVTSESGIGTAEKVVIGAAVLVAVLAVIALILRCLGPRFRNKSTNPDLEDQKLPIESVPTKLG